MKANTTVDMIIELLEVARRAIEAESMEDKYFNTDYGYRMERLSDQLFTVRMDLRSTYASRGV